MTTLRVEIPEYAHDVLKPARYISLSGGRDGTKSHTFAIKAVLLAANLLPDYDDEPKRIASARALKVQIGESVKIVVEHYIDKFGLRSEFKSTTYTIDNLRTGAHILFPGVQRSVESFPSMEGLDVFWMEQAESLTDEMDLIEPTLRKQSSEFWFSWNPTTRTGWCWRRFKQDPEPGDVIIHVNWRDNPWWLESGNEALRRRHKRTEPELYDWKWLGAPLDTDGQHTVLPYRLLEACVDAYRQGLAPALTGRQYAGLDLAEGGADQCALVVRDGPTFCKVASWPGVTGDLSNAATTAKEHCTDYNIVRIYYDASSPAKTDLRKSGFKGVIPVNFGGKVGGPEELYEPEVKNKDMFRSRNIQMAMALRLRALNTIRLINGENIDPARCLFIPHTLPHLPHILDELSQPTREFNVSTGRWELVKAAKGERSPDRFDGACLAWAVETDHRGLTAKGPPRRG